MITKLPATVLDDFLKAANLVRHIPAEVSAAAAAEGLLAYPEIHPEWGLSGYEIYRGYTYLGYADLTCPDTDDIVFWPPEAQDQINTVMDELGVPKT
jgi:hypothetical protein